MMGFGMASFMTNRDLRRKDEQIGQEESEARQHAEELRRIGAELQQAKLDLVRAQDARAPKPAEPSVPATAERNLSPAQKQATAETKPRAVPDRDTGLE